MADLYGTNVRSSSFESEEISSFLHNLLQNSFATPSPSSGTPFKSKHLHSFSSLLRPPPPPEVMVETTASGGSFRQSERAISDSDCRIRDGASAAMVDSSSSFNFSDPGSFFPTDASSAGIVDSDAITALMKSRKFPAENIVGGFNFHRQKGHEASEVPVNTAPPRSLKRSRTAEIHNLSEKRRRSRINEKMKALQNLIPNCNKTDKASMLDEAIEYLKQLQLQVQMLAMRNGLSLHPVHLPVSLQQMQLPHMRMDFGNGNGLLDTNRGADTFPGNDETLVRTAFDISNQNPTNQSVAMPSTENITNSVTSFGLEPTVQNQYGLSNHLMSSKDICRDNASLLQLDISCSGRNSSSAMKFWSDGWMMLLFLDHGVELVSQEDREAKTRIHGSGTNLLGRLINYFPAESISCLPRPFQT